jgi:hypothetical protein
MSIRGRHGILAIISVAWLASCATTSQHAFVEPTKEWQTRSGQLLYRGAKATLIGDVLVRYSRNGDFELTFSKGPAVTLLHIREEAKFVEFTGPLARVGWTGPIDDAPKQLRPWIELGKKIRSASDQPSVHYSSGGETFWLRF